MQKLRATKTASLTDLRDPMKVIRAIGSETAAILNRNKVVAYLTPASALEARTASSLPRETFDSLLERVLEEEKETLTALKDV